MKTLTIKYDDTRVGVTTEEPLSLIQFNNIVLTATLEFMETILQNAPDESKAQLKELIFNEFNDAASNLLARFAPEIDMRPDITEQAMLEAEVNYIDRKLAKHH